MLSNECIDELTPNPDAKPWQEFAELLIPIALAHCISFTLLSDTGAPVSELVYGATQEMIMRLFVVQFFLKKWNAAYFIVMLSIYLLTFYNTSAGVHIWRSMKYDKDESFFAQKAVYSVYIFNT